MSLFPASLGSCCHLLNEATLTTLLICTPLRPVHQASTFKLPFPVPAFLLSHDLPSSIILNILIMKLSVLFMVHLNPPHTPGQECVLVLSKDVFKVPTIVLAHCSA